MNIALYLVAALQTLGALLTIHGIGKPREPITHGTAVSVVILAAATVAVAIAAGMRLG